MSENVEVGCRCGEVHGWLTGGRNAAVGRIVCYCDDCQAYAHHLGRADILDSQGGTEVVPVAPAALSFDRGKERVVCLRLSSKGLYRWYTTCCKTPLGNVLSSRLPYIGVPVYIFGDSTAFFGPRIGAIQGKFAIGRPPPGVNGTELAPYCRYSKNHTKGSWMEILREKLAAPVLRAKHR